MDITEIPNEDSEPEEGKQEEETALVPVVTPTNAGQLLANAAIRAGVPIPADKLGVLQGFMDQAKYGHQARLPMECKGKACPVIKLCPLEAIGVALPFGKPCPVEGSLIEQWVQGYIDAIGIDPNEPESAIDMHMIYELAGLELMRTRAAHELSKNPDMVSEKIIGYSPHGEPVYDDKPNPALLIMEKQAKTVNKLRDALLATRKAQASVGQVSSDQSVRGANILANARIIAEKRRKGAKLHEIQEAEYEVKDESTPHTEPT